MAAPDPSDPFTDPAQLEGSVSPILLEASEAEPIELDGEIDE